MLQYCIYEGEYELKDADLMFMKTTFNDFKLTHLYKYNTRFQLLGAWTKNDVLGPGSYDDWHFMEPYFALHGLFESDTYKIFNSTREILEKVEVIDFAPANLNDILDKQRINLRKQARNVGTVKLSAFIHDAFLLYDLDNVIKKRMLLNWIGIF